MGRSVFDFIIEIHENILGNSEYIIYLELIVIFLVFINVGLSSFVYFNLKNNQIFTIGNPFHNLNNIDYIQNIHGINVRPEKIVFDSFRKGMQLIESKNSEDILLGLDYLKHHPNPISLQRMGEILASDDVPNEVREKALKNLNYTVNNLK